MDSELMQVLDILMDDPTSEPDTSAVSAVIAGSSKPIALVQGLVRLLWLAAERPDEFDTEVVALCE